MTTNARGKKFITYCGHRLSGMSYVRLGRRRARAVIPRVVFAAVCLVFSACVDNASVAGGPKPLYPNNREPLLETKYVKLPLGAVKPKGWLLDQLRVQANGLTGHLPEVWDVMKTTAWKGDTGEMTAKSTARLAGVVKTTTYEGNSGVNVYPECCWARFVPRWLEGLVPLAYELDDPKLKETVDRYMSFLLTVRNPASVTPSVTGWSHLGRVLPGYYEATKDERAVKLCGIMLDYMSRVRGDHMTPQPEAVQQTRLGMPLSFGWWYYNQTGDADALRKLEWISKNCVDYYRDLFNGPMTRSQHIVDIGQSIQYPVLFYLLAKDESYKTSVYEGMRKLDRLHGQVTGRWNGDEYLSGLSPTQGSELCSVTELVYSLIKSYEALGDPAFADRLESLVFNAVPGTCTGDWWAHQYDQQANQVLVSVDRRTWNGNGDSSNIFGFTPNYPCCLSNMHSPFPNYVEYMWMATGDNGLIAAAYGPCEVKAMAGGGTEVTITEETNYPFSGKVKLTVNCPQRTSFPIYLRIPAWARAAVLTLPGGKTSRPQIGSVVKVERAWKPGEVITLALNARVRTEPRSNRSVSVMWGPLVFSLRIGEAFQKINIPQDRRVFPDFPTGVADWRVDPTTDWNYALAIDPENPECEIVANAIGSLPFARKGEPVFLPDASDFTPWSEDVPLVLRVKARKVPEWGMDGASAAPVPASPVNVTTEEAVVELIPYGCTRLRISEFPLVRTISK